MIDQYARIPGSSFTLQNGAAKYVLFQRTQYIKFANHRLVMGLSRRTPLSMFDMAVSMEAKLRKSAIASQYFQEMKVEFETLKPHLPETCSAWMDIGCGIGGIDALIWHHYADNKASVDAPLVYLLDKTETADKVWYGFKKSGAFYNSLSATRDFLVDNGIASDRIHTIEANDERSIETSQSFDFIMSLISWGFHYPVETYLEDAHRLLKPDGKLMMDVRKDTDGLDALRQTFARVDIIDDTKKYARIMATK